MTPKNYMITFRETNTEWSIWIRTAEAYLIRYVFTLLLSLLHASDSRQLRVVEMFGLIFAMFGIL